VKKAYALVSELLDVESQFEESFRQLQVRESQLIDALFETIHAKPKPQATSEEKYRQKADKVLKLVQEQAFTMDKKMAELQKENIELRRLVEDNKVDPSNPTDSFAMLPSLQGTEQTVNKLEDIQNYSVSVDFELVEAFNKIEKAETPENYKELLVALMKRLIHERLQRQITEEQTGLMLEHERKSIRVLEDRKQTLIKEIKKAERSSLSNSKASESSGESVEESVESALQQSEEGADVSFKKTSVSIRVALKSSPPKPPAAPYLFTNEAYDQMLGYYKATYPESNAQAVEVLAPIYSSAISRLNS